GPCRRNRTEVVGKDSPQGQHLAESIQAQFLIILIFVAASLRGIDNNTNEPGVRLASAQMLQLLHSTHIKPSLLFRAPPTCKTGSLYCASASHRCSGSKNDADLCRRPVKVRFARGNKITLDIPLGRAMGAAFRNLAALGHHVILRTSQNEGLDCHSDSTWEISE